MFTTSSSTLSTIARARIDRRVLGSSKLNLSKLPEDFFNFTDIHLLPPRELAYTAHLAQRAELQNEDLWDRIKSAVMDTMASPGGFRPKQLTQCVSSLSEMLDSREAIQILQWVSSRVEKFRPNDLVSILHAVAGCDGIRGEHSRIMSIMNSIARHGDSMSPESIPVLISSVGKLGIVTPELERKIIDWFIRDGMRMDQFELAACVRAFARLGIPGSCSAIESILSKHACIEFDIEPGPLNIILNGLARFSKDGVDVSPELVGRLLGRLSRTLLAADLQLYPYMFHSAAQLVTDDEGKGVCVRLAQACVRQYKGLKPVSLPVVKEGLEILHTRFPDDADIRVISDSVSSLTESVVDQFLLLQSEHELEQLKHSKHCKYSPWLRARLDAFIGEEQSTPSNHPPVSDLLTVLAGIWNGEIPPAQLMNAWKDQDGMKTDTEFSLTVRILLRGKYEGKFAESVLTELVRGADQMKVRTLIRGLQLATLISHSSIELVELILTRVSEVDNGDLYPLLVMLERSGIRFNETTDPISRFQINLERKLCIALGAAKSLTKRNELISVAKSIGLDTEDAMDEYEQALFSGDSIS
jgi:hypothetical protein